MLRRLAVAMVVGLLLCCLAGCGKRDAAVEEATETSDSSELGVDIYPGAEPEPGGELRSQELPEGEAQSAALATSDAVGKVAEFYKRKYGEGATVLPQPDGGVVISKDEEAQIITIAVARPQDDEETHISITVVPKAEE